MKFRPAFPTSLANPASLTRAFLRALGVASAAAMAISAAACTGDVVVDAQPAGSGGAGGDGTPTGAGGGSAGLLCSAPVTPGNQLVYACGVAPTGGVCPPASDALVFATLTGDLSESVECPDSTPCECRTSVVAVPCGPDPAAVECCYYAELRTQMEGCEG